LSFIAQKPAVELAALVSQFRESFVQQHDPLKHHLRTLNAIQHCRTAYMGGHVDKCDNAACHKIRISYNSCRNRHCPKCQSVNTQKWVAARGRDVLPATYFHLVFTLPQQLHTFCMHYPKELYSILFLSAKETLETFGRDKKHLGAQTGMVAVLHTWGQNLSLHPHLHCLVPGGGITDAGYWKNCKADGNFLFPAKAMAIVYKNKFLEKMKAFLRIKGLPFDADLRKTLYHLNWVAYAKEPFLGAAQVIEYLGRYSHKVAISNHRLRSVANGKVTFAYKDYADGSKQKLMCLNGEEFLRRFCLHILPPGFMKIRHYGLLASRAKPKLRLLQMQCGVLLQNLETENWKIITKTKLGFDVDACPCCKTGKMIRICSFNAHAPPLALLAELLKPSNGFT
jgi:Putative transposase/Transposase zinc-binding domain